MIEVIRSGLRDMLPPQMYMWMAERFNGSVCIAKTGYRCYSALRNAAHDRARQDGTLLCVKLPTLSYPVYLRKGTTDSVEFIHTLIRETYKHPAPPDVRLIVDAGANIGDSTIWYLQQFPLARVIAVEPDIETFSVLRMNCEPYGNRVQLVHGGLWYRDTKLTVVESGQKNSQYVKEMDSTVGICGISMATLTGGADVDIFKCDIEGAELELFTHEYEPWLGRVRMMLIDIHSQAAKEQIMRVAKNAGFSCRQHREIHVFKRAC